jgi:hypothetical protein
MGNYGIPLVVNESIFLVYYLFKASLLLSDPGSVFVGLLGAGGWKAHLRFR